MERSESTVAKPGETSHAMEAKLSYEPEKNLQTIDGHLQQLLHEGKVQKFFQNPRFHFLPNPFQLKLSSLHLFFPYGQQLPGLPGSHRFGKPSWLAPLLATAGFTVGDHLRQWGLSPLLVFAKHYHDMYIHWDAISALIEIWHPQTHTFIFPSFEASILIEEVELFLGVKPRHTDIPEVAHCMELPDTRAFILDLTNSWIQAKNIALLKGIKLSKLAAWIMRAKDQGVKDEMLARGVSLCLAGVFLFLTYNDVLDQEHLGVIQSTWQGKSMVQPILSHLYSGLTSASMGGPFYGSAILLDIWISFHLKMDFGRNEDMIATSYIRSPIYRIRDALHYTDSMVVKTLQLRSRTDWRDYLIYLSRFDFVFSSEALAKLEFKIRPSQGVDLLLIGSKDLVLYNAHRCLLQIGQARHEIARLSHHPPITPRSLGTRQDHVEVRTCLELWKIGRTMKLEEACVDEDRKRVKSYAHKLRTLRTMNF